VYRQPKKLSDLAALFDRHVEGVCRSRRQRGHGNHGAGGMPGLFVPVEMRQTGMRGTGYGTREEAYGGADHESAATG
jgi:hypothetical protein